MPRRLVAVVLLLAGFAATGRPAERPAVADEARPRWLTDFEAARATARLSGKPIFAIFR
jgi:hypothetical protein